MFNPSRDEVRRFFAEAWRKSQEGNVLTPLEIVATDWIREHPEHHAALLPNALDRDYGVEEAQTNPFLHLSMHLSIAEQVSIDQPRGIRAAMERLAARTGSWHEAHHAAMDCLGEMLWNAQRNGLPPDGEAYVACVSRRATAD